ncbi:MAG TPA: low molecular weight protein arginine phosphatase [Candidatus Eisenbacteria bacterium]
MFQVLLVCTGNTCRSPMAEGILRSLLTPDLDSQVTVTSAGTGAVEGVPAAPHAIETTAARGIDIRGHRSRPLTARLLRESDLVLGMEPGHLSRAAELAPDVRDRVHMITERGAEPRAEAGADVGIHDPIGGGSDEYVDAFHRIRSHLLRWVPVIRDAVERSEGVR